MHAGSSDGKCSVLPGCACRKYHSSRRDAFKPINQEALGQIVIDRDDIRVELTPEAHDARVEAISPKLFDEGVRIAQFISDPHLHRTKSKELLTRDSMLCYSMVQVWGIFRFQIRRKIVSRIPGLR